MKASFAITNPTLTRVDWSFIPKVFGETTTKEGQTPPKGAEEGEVTGAIHIAEDVVVFDEPKAGAVQAGVEAVHPDQP